MGIPEPVVQFLEINTFGKPWYLQLWIAITAELRVRFINDWKITLADGMEIMIPAGEVTDGSSIPRLFRWLVRKFGVLRKGAYIHDYGFKYGYLKNHKGELIFRGRNMVFFNSIMETVNNETNGMTRLNKAIRKVLDWFGSKAWDRYRKEGPYAYGRFM